MAKRKKILLLSDDLRMNSGVGTMSREFVLGTLDHYEWVQIGGAIKHPDEGDYDTNDSLVKKRYRKSLLKNISVSGYKSRYFEWVMMEKDVELYHYTDLTFWGWLYQMEHELRQNIPTFTTIYGMICVSEIDEPFYEVVLNYEYI